MNFHWRKLFFVPIGVAIVVILLIIMIQTPHEFITKEDAMKIVASQYNYSTNTAYFVFLKYNGTYKDGPRFIIYQADPDSKTMQGKDHSMVFYKHVLRNGGDEYFSPKLIDRFSWGVTYSGGGKGCCAYFYVDAKTGEVIGENNPQADCSNGVCIGPFSVLPTGVAATS